MNWKTEVFRYFIEGKANEKGKGVPKFKTQGTGCHPLSWDDALLKPIFGGILNEGFTDVSVDDPDQWESLLKMIKSNNGKCLILENPLKKTGHTIWKDSFGRIKKKSYTNAKTAVGFIVDVHSGNTYIRLKEPTHNRFPQDEPDSIDEIPAELLIVDTKKDLWNMPEGAGRNSELYGYIQVLQTQLHLTNDKCRDVIKNINEFVFQEPLSEDELTVILREESFLKYEVTPLTSISASELMKMEIEPVYFAVKDVLPMGLSIIASPPKFGKSYLCTQLSLAVASGSQFLGFDTNRSGVLYMALEDSFNRCKERLIQELQGKEAPNNLDIMIDCPSIGNGLIEQLQDYIKNHPTTKLIIIDTFAKIRDGSKSNEGAYSADYREAGLVKKFADRNQLAVLLVHHTRKMKDVDDPFANISGTQGLTGACDTMIVLTKDKRSDDLTHFHITGRDVIQNEYGISRNDESGLWMRYDESIDALKNKAEIGLMRYKYSNSNIRKTILYILQEKEQWTGRCSDIIKVSKEIGYPITETSQKLSRILDEMNGFMIEEDRIYHSMIQNGTGSKQHKFERSS